MQLKAGVIAHAYLFSGPRGIGKTTLARIFSKALNCESVDKKTGEPCGTCVCCKSFSEGLLLDVIEIDAASHTGVDTVRETVIDTARLMPSVGKYKVFIIDEVHMLSTSAFNALLKIIEEPPEHVVFIFATTESMKVPATIISRCQRFDFKKLTNEDIVARLASLTKKEKRSVDKSVLESIAKFSDGAMRDAESLLGQVLTLSDKTITLDHASLLLPVSHIAKVRELATLIVEHKTAEAVDFLNKLVADGVDLPQFSQDLLELWRLALLKKINAAIVIHDAENEAWVTKHLPSLTVERIQSFITHTTAAIREAAFETTLITLPLEMLIVSVTAEGEQ